MSQTSVYRTVVVANRAGLHLRAAMLIAKTAREFGSVVSIVKAPQRVEATDILQIISLGALEGTELRLECAGPNAEAALDAMARLFSDKFGEDREPESGPSREAFDE